MKISLNVDVVEFVGTKKDTNFDEVLKSIPTAKKIRIITYSIPNKPYSNKLDVLRKLRSDVDLRLILALPGLENVKIGGYIDYNSYEEQSLEDKITSALQRLDVKSFSHRPKIDICFKNHAKLIGTEDILYVGSANYSDGTYHNYEAGVIIRDKTVIENIYDSFVDKFITVPFYGDDLDKLRICVLELYESLEDACALLSGYENYNYVLTCIKDDADELIEKIDSIINKVEDALVPVQQYTGLCEDISDMLSDIKEYLGSLEKNSDFWDALESMDVEKSLEILNDVYRDELGLPNIPPSGPEFISEDTMFVPLYDMPFDEVENLIDIKGYWYKAFGGTEEIDEVHDDFNAFRGSVYTLISDILQQEEDAFKEQVIQNGHDSTIIK